MIWRIWLTVVTLVACGAGLSASQQPSGAERLYNAYAAGDPGVVARTLQTIADCRALQNDFLTFLETPKKPMASADPVAPRWAPVRIAFAFDVGMACASHDVYYEGARWMTPVRELLSARPVGAASRAVTFDDQYEVLVHCGVVALLATVPQSAAAYLEAIAGRIDRLRRLADGETVVARLVLARGMIAEARTRPLTTEARTVAIRSLTSPGSDVRLGTTIRDPGVEVLLKEAASAYTRAAAVAALAPEADVRRGLVLHRLGDQKQALAAVDRGLATSSDPEVLYWGHLIRGRVLEAMERLPEARTAYERAAALMPMAQTPAVAIAALALLQNDRPAAERWAALARDDRDRASDPWWAYWFADLRILDRFVASIRRARP